MFLHLNFCDWNNPIEVDQDLNRTPEITSIQIDSEQDILIYLNYEYSDQSNIILERKTTSAFEVISYKKLSGLILVDTLFNKEFDYTFTYRIRIEKNGYYSEYSQEKTFQYTSSFINTPANFEAKTVELQGIQLRWTDRSNKEDGYIIEKNGLQIATLQANSVSYFDSITGLPNPPLSIIYKIKAFINDISSNWINLNVSYTGIAPPTNLRIVHPSLDHFTIQWQDNSMIETGYLIERKKDYESYSVIKTLDANSYQYIDSLNDRGIYSYKVQAQKDNLYSDYSNEISIIVTSKPPQAGFTWSPSNPWINETVTFDASSSIDDYTELSNLQVRWDFENDGTFDKDWTITKIAMHTYSIAGVYSVQLQVRDEDNLIGIITKDVMVTSSQSPKACFSVTPSAGTINTLFSFDASCSSDPSGESLEYRWDFENDGTWDTGFSSIKTVIHQFSTQDTIFTIKLMIKNSEGLTNLTTKTIPIGKFEGFENGIPSDWIDVGDVPWSLNTTVVHSGTYALCSGSSQLKGQSSEIQKTVIGPLIVRFWLYKGFFTSEFSLYFYVDNYRYLSLDYNYFSVGWTEYIFQISTGEHRLLWVCWCGYEPSAGNLDGEYLHLDDVEFIPISK